jgi:membrane protein implicated in regulation of membrane protease activity
MQRRHGEKNPSEAEGITLVVGGEAGASEGDFESCLNWSTRPGRELPVLMLVTNNRYGISTDLHTSSMNAGMKDMLNVMSKLLALGMSLLVGGFLWIVVRKTVDAARIKPAHNLNDLVGQVGEAKSRIQNEGTVQVAGEEWSARSDTPIAAGDMIRVVKRDGFVLIVEKTD